MGNRAALKRMPVRMRLGLSSNASLSGEDSGVSCPLDSARAGGPIARSPRSAELLLISWTRASRLCGATRLEPP